MSICTWFVCWNKIIQNCCFLNDSLGTTLDILLCYRNFKFSQLVQINIVTQILALRDKFARRTRNINLLGSPFIYNILTAPVDLQVELTDHQVNNTLKENFKSLQLLISIHFCILYLQNNISKNRSLLTNKNLNTNMREDDIQLMNNLLTSPIKKVFIEEHDRQHRHVNCHHCHHVVLFCNKQYLTFF